MLRMTIRQRPTSGTAAYSSGNDLESRGSFFSKGKKSTGNRSPHSSRKSCRLLVSSARKLAADFARYFEYTELTFVQLRNTSFEFPPPIQLTDHTTVSFKVASERVIRHLHLRQLLLDVLELFGPNA